jgi:hypothetical protein
MIPTKILDFFFWGLLGILKHLSDGFLRTTSLEQHARINFFLEKIIGARNKTNARYIFILARKL